MVTEPISIIICVPDNARFGDRVNPDLVFLELPLVRMVLTHWNECCAALGFSHLVQCLSVLVFEEEWRFGNFRLILLALGLDFCKLLPEIHTAVLARLQIRHVLRFLGLLCRRRLTLITWLERWFCLLCIDLDYLPQALLQPITHPWLLRLEPFMEL